MAEELERGCPLNFHLETDEDFDRFVVIMRIIMQADLQSPGGQLTGVVPGFAGRVVHVSDDEVSIDVTRRPGADVPDCLSDVVDGTIIVRRERWVDG